MSLIAGIYRSLVPESIRYRVLRYRTARKLHGIKQNILNYYKSHPTGEAEINQALSFLEAHELTVFPYRFSEKYSPDTITVLLDEASQLHYVMLNSHRLYFKRGLTAEQIRHAYAFLLCEQDPESPHCYLPGDFKLEVGAVLADVGCAEGIFTLMNIDTVKKAVLFEADQGWMEALEKTFAPWKEKVSLVNKFVSDRTEGNFVRLDDHFREQKPDFLKIDVDGAEDELLRGSRELLSSQKLQVALCTYHKQQDAQKFEKLFREMNYQTSFTKNYMLFYFDEAFEAPYFRKALLRAVN